VAVRDLPRRPQGRNQSTLVPCRSLLVRAACSGDTRAILLREGMDVGCLTEDVTSGLGSSMWTSDEAVSFWTERFSAAIMNDDENLTHARTFALAGFRVKE
jgi:hypothetical protein